MEGDELIIEKSKPWLVPNSVIFLEAVLTSDSSVLEAGAGASTVWFAKRAKHVLSFEHNKSWYDNVKETLEYHGIKNVDLRHEPEYPKKGLTIEGLFDVILIDGRGRVKTAMSILRNLKAGGYLILDNAERAKYDKIIKVMRALKYPSITFTDKWITMLWRKGG